MVNHLTYHNNNNNNAFIFPNSITLYTAIMFVRKKGYAEVQYICIPHINIFAYLWLALYSFLF